MSPCLQAFSSPWIREYQVEADLFFEFTAIEWTIVNRRAAWPFFIDWTSFCQIPSWIYCNTQRLIDYNTYDNGRISVLILVSAIWPCLIWYSLTDSAVHYVLCLFQSDFFLLPGQFSLSIANTTSFYIYLVYRYFDFDISFKLFRQPTFWKQHIKWFISWQKSWKCCEIRKEILDFNNFVDLTKLYIDLMHRLDPKISLMWIRLFEPLLFSILQFLDII